MRLQAKASTVSAKPISSRSHPTARAIGQVVLLAVTMTVAIATGLSIAQPPPGGAAVSAALAALLVALLSGAAVHSMRDLHRRATREARDTAERRAWETETARCRAAQSAAQQAQERLQDAVESISEALVIFDADDRLVMFNEAYQRLYAQSAEAVAPGTSFEAMLRIGIGREQYPDATGREEEWLAERLRNHRELSGAVEQLLPDGRYLLITERRMRNGGTAGLHIDITRLKETEIRLRESTESLDRIQRIAGIGSIEIALDSRIVSWSPGACAIFGIDYPEVEPTRRFLLNFVHPDDRDMVEAAAREANASGVAAPPLEYRIIRADGAERVVYRENAIKYDAAFRGVSRTVTFKDITQLKATETQLRELMANLDRAQRLVHVGSYVRDIAGKAEWSAEMYRIFGVDPQTFKPTRRNVVRLVVPEDRAKIINAYRQVARGICPVGIEHKIRRPNGEIRLIHSNFELIQDRTGRVTGMGGTIWDITEMRRTEIQLREMMDNLDRAQRLAHMGSYTRDIDGTGRWSAEVYRIFGVDPATFEPTMESFLSTVVAEDRAVVAAAHRQMQDGIPTEPFEYRIRRPNGEIRHIHRITELIRDHNGKVAGTGGTLWDITELRAAEERQKELERQLLHSQKLEALGQLAGGVAHDLNNTLVPILSLSKLALEDIPESDPLREDMLTIITASERARDLVRQILAFSRKQEIQKREIDLAAAVRQALQMLRATVPSNITLVEEVHEVPRIFADGGQLQQVVVNLVTNAAQAIGDAHGSIIVELAAAASHSGRRGRRFVRLRVADTGPGIDKAILDRIFEPFFTTKPVGEGTGLGLAVVHGIVTGHGGTIEAKSSVRSKPRKGTVFTILLPLPEPNILGAAA